MNGIERHKQPEPGRDYSSQTQVNQNIKIKNSINKFKRDLRSAEKKTRRRQLVETGRNIIRANARALKNEGTINQNDLNDLYAKVRAWDDYESYGSWLRNKLCPDIDKILAVAEKQEENEKVLRTDLFRELSKVLNAETTPEDLDKRVKYLIALGTKYEKELPDLLPEDTKQNMINEIDDAINVGEYMQTLRGHLGTDAANIDKAVIELNQLPAKKAGESPDISARRMTISKQLVEMHVQLKKDRIYLRDAVAGQKLEHEDLVLTHRDYARSSYNDPSAGFKKQIDDLAKKIPSKIRTDIDKFDALLTEVDSGITGMQSKGENQQFVINLNWAKDHIAKNEEYETYKKPVDDLLARVPLVEAEKKTVGTLKKFANAKNLLPDVKKLVVRLPKIAAEVYPGSRRLEQVRKLLEEAKDDTRKIKADNPKMDVTPFVKSINMLSTMTIEALEKGAR